ncbi:unnamed protein product, partial [Allacma fusca]
VQLQTQCPENPKYRGTFHCLSSIARQESIAGLYKGIASPLYGVAAVNAIIFGVYGQLKPFVSGPTGNDALWAHFIAGSASGSVQSIVASPMELVKTRMQLDDSVKGSSKGPSAWQVLKNIYLREGGIRKGVFKGWGITLGREIPGFGFYFSTYEALTRGGREITTPEMLMAGGMAGVASWIACFPMDVVKTRLQSDTQGKYMGTIDCIRKTMATEGYRAFFRGLNSTVIRAFPTNAATFTTVTWIMRLAQQQEDNSGLNQNSLEILLEQWGSLSGKIADFGGSMLLQSSSITSEMGLIASFKSSPKQESRIEERVRISTISLPENKVAGRSNELDVRTRGKEPSGFSPETSGDAEPNATFIASTTGNSSQNFPLAPTTLVPTPTKGKVQARGNSHDAGSLPADLGILAEILDLPLIVLENSLDGKPITLFNIIFTWLMEKAPLRLCKCLDALDQCVCLAR